MKKIIVSIAALFAILAFIAAGYHTDVGQALLGHFGFVKSVEVDRGTYFRVKVKVAYKGEPQDFDIVVACSVLRINYSYGDSTYEAGLTPTVYGRRMSDGKGLVLRLPDACNGQTTANGRVPTDFLPVILVYDDAATLGFGTAHISDDAYESPLSVLTFGGATVGAATRAEFEAFRRDGPANLITSERYKPLPRETNAANVGVNTMWPMFGKDCWAYRRFRIPEEQRAHIRSYWPADHPTYWVPPDREARGAAFDPIDRLHRVAGDTDQEVVSMRRFAGAEYFADLGVVRAGGDGRIDGPEASSLRGSSFFPARQDLAQVNWSSDPDTRVRQLQDTSELANRRIDFQNGAARGFAYCYLTAPLVQHPEFLSALKGKRWFAEVDGNEIRNMGGFASPDALIFYERDEFFFEANQFYLDSTRGGV